MIKELRFWVILGVSVAAVAGTFLLPRIPQNPGYHELADQRVLWGVRHFGDVVSNLAFIVVGALGFRKYELSKTAGLHPSYVVYCLGVIAVGVGSARYHLDPSNATMVWDRLAMAITFMGFFALILGDRVSPMLGRWALWPLLAAGLGSVVYWHTTELAGAGDLRPYILVQFLPVALLVVLLCAYRSRYLRSAWLWGSLGMYALAKLGEYLDRWLYEASGVISGHTLKHLLAAAGVFLVIVSLRDPGPLDEPANDH